MIASGPCEEWKRESQRVGKRNLGTHDPERKWAFHSSLRMSPQVYLGCTDWILTIEVCSIGNRLLLSKKFIQDNLHFDFFFGGGG